MKLEKPWFYFAQFSKIDIVKLKYINYLVKFIEISILLKIFQLNLIHLCMCS